jgi:hypothetical protein
MKTRSRALVEWQRQTRKSWQQLRAREKGVVHFSRTVGYPRPARGVSRREAQEGAAVRRFLLLGLILLGCIAWLVSLAWR